jgi:hypothetical protein
MGIVGEPSLTFNDDLKFSQSKEGSLDRIYSLYFENTNSINKIDRISDMNRQRHGIDTEIILASGEKVVIQEKWRRRKFEGDFLIECCSVWRYPSCRNPGWIYTVDADYIFTVYEQSGIVKIYPVVQLKLAWSNNKDKWLKDDRYKKIYVENKQRNFKDDYDTLSVVIPCEELEREITKVMKFEYQQKLDI